PTVAVLSANTVAALVLAGVVGWVGYAKTKRALDAEAKRLEEANNARAEAVQASEKLEANLRLSLEALEKVFEAAAASREGVGFGPGMRPLPPGGPGGFGGGPGGPGGVGGGGVFGSGP